MLARHINVIGRAGYFFAQHSLSDTGLNGVDHGVIEYVAHHPGVSQEGLRSHFNKDKSTVARAMVRLEEAGYVLAGSQSPVTSGKTASTSPTRASFWWIGSRL